MKYAVVLAWGALFHKKLHFVVSHGWMQNYIQGFTNISASIHVISKCGNKMEGAPKNAQIQVLPNVGRCDHTYAYYITRVLPKMVTPGDDNAIVVVFLSYYGENSSIQTRKD